MSTSGTGAVNAVLYVVVLACAVRAAIALLDGAEPGRPPRRALVAALALWLAVAIPSLLQVPFPGVRHALERDPDLIRGHGQWWRLGTSVLVQDGGTAGTIFNLVALALIAVLATWTWGSARALIIFAVAAIAFDVAATFVSPSAGAGNSGATLALAASMTGLALVTRRRPATALPAAVAAGCGGALLALLDAHGEAVLGGLVIGLLISAVSAPDERRTAAGGNR